MKLQAGELVYTILLRQRGLWDAVTNRSDFPFIRLMDKILHDPKDPKLWELWYIPYYGSCRILSINRKTC